MWTLDLRTLVAAERSAWQRPIFVASRGRHCVTAFKRALNDDVEPADREEPPALP